MLPMLPTSLVGSYAQPEWLIDRSKLAKQFPPWLIDRSKLAKQFPPRVRARELWRIDPEWLEEAQDDATRLAVLDQEKAGIDIITDGEIRRESYSNRFAAALDGIDLDNPGPRSTAAAIQSGAARRRQAQAQRSRRSPRPEIPQGSDGQAREGDGAGPLHHVAAGAERFLQDRGRDGARLRGRRERRDARPVRGRADVVQIDEPYMQARPEKARAFGVAAVERALDGVKGTTALHICFGYAAIIHERPTGYSFLPELGGDVGASRSRSKPRSPIWTARC